MLQKGSGAGFISGCIPTPGDIPKNTSPATCLLPLVPTAHTPDNSFMGFVSEELNQTERQLIKANKASSMAVVYGKEASIWKVGVLGLLGTSQAGRGRHRQSWEAAPASGSHPELWRCRSGCVCGEPSLSWSWGSDVTHPEPPTNKEMLVGHHSLLLALGGASFQQALWLRISYR